MKKKLLIALAVIIILLVVAYQALSHFFFKMAYDDCMSRYKDNQLVKILVDDVSQVCECTVEQTKKVGLIGMLRLEDGSPEEKALRQRVEDQCVTPHMNTDNIFSEMEKSIKSGQ